MSPKKFEMHQFTTSPVSPDQPYFQSSFARSMVYDTSQQPRSMDYGLLNRPGMDTFPSPRYQCENSESSAEPNCLNRYRKKASQSSPDNEELARLRLECKTLTDENKRLKDINVNDAQIRLLQMQVDTLKWQLQHVESNRQSYRALLGLICKFLERVHSCFDANNFSSISSSPNASPKGNRVTRARSAHAIAGDDGDTMSASSSCSSPSTYRHARSTPQPSSYNSLSFYWNSRRDDNNEECKKLSQEAFRLLRTAQSLMDTREPNIANGFAFAGSDLALPECGERNEVSSVGSCSSLLRNSCESSAKSSDSSSSATESHNEEHTAQPLFSENESGFNSLNSDTIAAAVGSYNEVGLPKSTENDLDITFGKDFEKRSSKSVRAETQLRRDVRSWSSTPVKTAYTPHSNPEADNFHSQVLWV